MVPFFSIKKIRFLAAVLCVALLLPLTACSGEERPENADQTILFHLQSDPATLDPQVVDSYAGRIAVEALFEGLVRLDSDGKPYPGVAESWEVDSSNTRYTFHLRSDAQWSKTIVTEDGESYPKSSPSPLTAQDFVFAWRRAADPQTKCPEADLFSVIQNGAAVIAGEMSADQLGVSAPADHTLVVQLEHPSEDFLSLTARTAFMPCQEAFFQWTSGRYGLEAKYTCGNGPFVFGNSYSWDHEEKMSLRRSTSYHGEKEPLPAALELFTNPEVTDISDPVAAVGEGVVDLAPLPAGSIEKAKGEGQQIITLSMDAVWGLCFNTEDDLLKDTTARKLFVQTLNREKLLQSLPKDAAAADDIIPDTFLYDGESYREQAGSGFYLKEDAAAAAGISKLLQRLKLDVMPSITVLGTKDTQELLNQMLISWNGSMGNYFNMETMSEEELTGRIQKGEFQAAVVPLRTEDASPLSLLSLFASDSQENPARLHSSEYDSHLAAAALGGEEGLAGLQSAEQFLNQQAIFYPLYTTDRYFTANETLTGVVIHPAGMGIDFIQAGKLD